MEKLILILILIPFACFSQSETNNFKIEGSEFIWQKVYDTRLSFDDITKELRAKGELSITDIDKDGSSISGDFSEIKPDVKGAGLKDMSTPMYASRTVMSGNFRIDFKEGRYRTTVSRVKVVFMDQLQITRTVNDYSWLAYFGVANNKIDPKFLKKGAKAFDYTFNRMFDTSVPVIKSNDDW